MSPTIEPADRPERFDSVGESPSESRDAAQAESDPPSLDWLMLFDA